MSRNHRRRHRDTGGKRGHAVLRKPQEPVGAPPGTLFIPPTASKPIIRLLQYAPQRVHEEQITDVTRLPALVREDQVTWIDVQGFGDVRALWTIAELFGLHPLQLEDIVHVPQRPKVQAYENNVLVVTRMAMLKPSQEIDMDQVSLVIGSHFVLTFQEHYGDVLDPVRARIREGIGLLRHGGPDLLAYSILDATIDGYFPVLETLGERLEELEDRITACPEPAELHTVHRLRRDLLAVRRGIWPQREAINSLIREDNPLISLNTRTHLRDVYDHCVQLIDVVETYRELASGLMDLYLSSIASRQNDIMRVLTVIATIFIPLTFVAGIYGMNFDWMPELHEWWGYPSILAVMALIASGMLVYFGRKGWLR